MRSARFLLLSVLAAAPALLAQGQAPVPQQGPAQPPPPEQPQAPAQPGAEPGRGAGRDQGRGRGQPAVFPAQQRTLADSQFYAAQKKAEGEAKPGAAAPAAAPPTTRLGI